jgi:hypothetical protein
MSEMIDRIASVLEKLPIRDKLDSGSELDQLRLREAARAVIEAMRHPTAEMLYFGTGNKEAVSQWNQMIDKAVK